MIGVAPLVDTPDLIGRSIELARLLGIHGGAPVALVEANLRDRSRLATALGIDAAPGLRHALEEPHHVESAIRPTPDPRLFVMTSGADEPVTSIVSADRFDQVTASLRSGGWVTPRPIVDLRENRATEVLGPAPLGADGVGATAPRAAQPRLPGLPPLPPMAPSSASPDPDSAGGGDLQPFNESAALHQLPPFDERPARSGAHPRAGLPGGRRPAVSLVVGPPLDQESDGDVVARSCDHLVLMVHAARITREELAEAVDRVGHDRFVGAVLITATRRKRR